MFVCIIYYVCISRQLVCCSGDIILILGRFAVAFFMKWAVWSIGDLQIAVWGNITPWHHLNYTFCSISGGRYRSWKRRWFILNDNCLYYFQYTQVSQNWIMSPILNLNELDFWTLKIVIQIAIRCCCYIQSKKFLAIMKYSISCAWNFALISYRANYARKSLKSSVFVSY